MPVTTNDLALLAPPPPEVAALVRALQENAGETRRYLGIMAGTVPIAEFLAPANLAAIMGTGMAA